jgi:hypothetical protein
MLLVSSRYRDQKVTIDDSCAHCVERIRITIHRGELVEVNPQGVYVLLGGS